MRILLLISFFVSKICFCQNTFIEAGLDYRIYPIDVEDAPNGPLPSSTYGSLTGDGFWKTISIHGRWGILTKNYWAFSFSTYIRYNHNHYKEEPYYIVAPTVLGTDQNTPDKSKLKFDFFFDIEKKVRTRKTSKNYLFLLGGIGFTNVNSGTNFPYLRGVFTGSPQPARYKGSFLHIGPRFSLGYQYKRIKSSIDIYIIEDPGLTNYTSLWFGASLSYELMLKSKKRK